MRFLPALLRFLGSGLLTCLLPAAVVAAPVTEPPVTATHSEIISLAGAWRLQLDPKGEGLNARWFMRELTGATPLPGSLPDPDDPTRARPYLGVAWYQRAVEIPDAWQGKRITLRIERTHSCTVWMDDVEIDSSDSLSSTQTYDITHEAKPGVHRLTLRVDNLRLVPRSAHIADRAPVLFLANGVHGEIALHATDPVWIESVFVTSDLPSRSARVQLELASLGRRPVGGRLTADARSWNHPAPARAASTVTLDVAPSPRAMLELMLPLGADAPVWHVDAPALHRLELVFTGQRDGQSVSARHTLDFGLRSIEQDVTGFRLNHTRLALRTANDTDIKAQLSSAAAPMAYAWATALANLRASGFNHLRFEGWCPPAAAFRAADRLGLLLQPSLPDRAPALPPGARLPSPGEPMEFDLRSRYYREEGFRLLRELGDHASFAFLNVDADLAPQPDLVRHLTAVFSEFDHRRRVVHTPR